MQAFSYPLAGGSLGGAGGSVNVEDVQGYYGLLTGFYFGGVPTETEIDENNVDTWVDVVFSCLLYTSDAADE